jgi:hypothetical protein
MEARQNPPSTMGIDAVEELAVSHIDEVLRRRILQFLLFLISFLIFIVAPVYTVPADAKYTILVSESFLEHHTAALNGYLIPGLDAAALPAHPQKIELRPFYQLVKIDGRILHRYPSGTPMLALPFVAIANAAGLSAANPDGSYNAAAEIRIQRLLASLLMALLTVIFFRMAAILLPISWSLAIAGGAASGTQVMSVATRSLCAHTFEILLAGLVLYVILKAELRNWRLHPVILATLLSWMFFVRPTGAIPVAAVSIFVLLRYRRDFPLYAVAGVLWLDAFFGYSWSTIGQLLPDYYLVGNGLGASYLPSVIAANLISPSRGLFIFVPAVLAVIYLVVRHWRTLPQRPLVVLAIGVIVAHLVLISTWPVWWGGCSFGPRLLTDMVPWFVMLAIFGGVALRRYCAGDLAGVADAHAGYRRVVLATTAALTLIGVAINGWAACSWAPASWGIKVAVDYHPERVWDWRTPQFLAGIVAEARPRPSPR